MLKKDISELLLYIGFISEGKYGVFRISGERIHLYDNYVSLYSDDYKELPFEEANIYLLNKYKNILRRKKLSFILNTKI